MTTLQFLAIVGVGLLNALATFGRLRYDRKRFEREETWRQERGKRSRA